MQLEELKQTYIEMTTPKENKERKITIITSDFARKIP